MDFRKPTIPELFPQAMQTDLSAKQATQYINNVFETVGRHVIDKNLPTELFIEEHTSPMIIESKPGHFYVGTYLKNHWKMILLSIGAGIILLRIYQISNEEKRKKNLRNMSRTFKPLYLDEKSE